MSFLREIIEEITEAFLVEAVRLGKFDLGHFRFLPDLVTVNEYPNGKLQFLGHGSSRNTWVFSSGKVLKAAYNDAGIAQNEQELKIAQMPEVSDIVTKIYDYDRDGNKWLISEIVRPLSGFQEFESLAGISFPAFKDFLQEWSRGNHTTPDEMFDDLIENQEMKLEDINPRNVQAINAIKRRLLDYRATRNNPFLRKMLVLISKGLLPGDLANWDLSDNSSSVSHYGKSGDGRIVLMDYGFSDDVYRGHYKSAASVSPPSEDIYGV